MKLAMAATSSSFNPRAHAGRDEQGDFGPDHQQRFNPRAHAGRDRKPHRRPRADRSFNPRAHAGRDFCVLVDALSGAQFQSTRPRGARRAEVIELQLAHVVSIHAPTRGATRQRVDVSDLRLVSIHAPTRGATGRDANIKLNKWFQSTRPRGARRWGLSAPRCANRCFNPRAHAGRDRRPEQRLHRTARFNPRAHAGRDRMSCATPAPWWQFQSTRPRGARRSTIYVASREQIMVSIHAPTRGATRPRSGCGRSRCCFNPRAHAGRDRTATREGVAVLEVSIHAPTRGATRIPPLGAAASTNVSIHAPTRGATPASRPTAASWQSFNPRAHAGRDWPCSPCRTRRGSFNPRAHAGRDSIALHVAGAALVVSIHAPTRGATHVLGRVARHVSVSIHAPTRGATRNYAAGVS